ncbi:MAG: regulatory protein RecX [Spirochaetia bacterium]|nr:regulatory protein RecX [Spirochaetia bacterium]
MDRKAHAESSSSQNDKTFFGRIERGVNRNSFVAAAEDGSSFFVPGKFAEQLHLYNGQELTEYEYSTLKDKIDFWRAESKAVDLLAVREHSTAELRIKLARREFSEKTINHVITSLTESCLLSDRRYAETWIRVRLRKNPEGRAMLSAGLARKGVDRSVIREVLDECIDEETLADALESAAAKLLRSRNMGRDKMLRALIRRGFDYGHVLKVVNRSFPNQAENTFD